MLYVLSFSAGDNSKVNDRIINILNSSTSIFYRVREENLANKGLLV